MQISVFYRKLNMNSNFLSLKETLEILGIIGTHLKRIRFRHGKYGKGGYIWVLIGTYLPT